MLGNMSAALFMHRRIITTLGKARYTRRFAERMITFARRGSVADRRHVKRYIRDGEAVKLLFTDLGPHFKNRNGGYTRIIKIGSRQGDAAPMAILELVGFDDAVAAPTSKKGAKSRLKTAQKSAVEGKKKKKAKAAPEKRAVSPEDKDLEPGTIDSSPVEDAEIKSSAEPLTSEDEAAESTDSPEAETSDEEEKE